MSNKLPRANKTGIARKISFKSLTEENWNDFEHLFGVRGACGGCWCMYWRLKRSEFVKNKGGGNKKKIKELVREQKNTGILMYLDKKVAGWCSVSPRQDFTLLDNSRVLRKVDDLQVWSVVCFFITKDFRRMGLTVPFLHFVIDYCRRKGAGIVEAYPVDVDSKDYPTIFAHVGFYSSFKKAGFQEVARRSATRPIMRMVLTP